MAGEGPILRSQIPTDYFRSWPTASPLQRAQGRGECPGCCDALGRVWSIRATVANGGKRQDPLTFTMTKEADDDQGDAEDPGDDSNDPGSGDSDDDSDDNNSDDDGDSGNNGPIPTVGSWQPPVVQLPAWMEGKVAAVRVGKAYNMKPIGGNEVPGPADVDPMWNGPLGGVSSNRGSDQYA